MLHVLHFTPAAISPLGMTFITAQRNLKKPPALNISLATQEIYSHEGWVGQTGIYAACCQLSRHEGKGGPLITTRDIPFIVGKIQRASAFALSNVSFANRPLATEEVNAIIRFRWHKCLSYKTMAWEFDPVVA